MSIRVYFLKQDQDNDFISINSNMRIRRYLTPIQKDFQIEKQLESSSVNCSEQLGGVLKQAARAHQKIFHDSFDKVGIKLANKDISKVFEEIKNKFALSSSSIGTESKSHL